jgi:hypothetical protein
MSNDISFEIFEAEWLTEIKTGKPSTIELGNRFSRKLITQWLEVSEDDDSPDDIVFCDGTGDGGIDIAVLQRGDDTEENTNVGDTWYLVQSKFGSAFAGPKTLLGEAQKVIDSLDGKRQNLSSLAAGLVERLQTFRNKASPKDRLVLVFATQRPLSDDEGRYKGDG